MEPKLFELKTTLGALFVGAMEANLDHVRIAGVSFSEREISALLDIACIDTYDGRVVSHIMEKQIRNIKMGDISYLKVLCGGNSIKSETIGMMIAYV